MTTTPKELGAALLRRRRQLGMSQREVAERIGMNRSNVSRMERGIILIPTHRFFEWCNVLKLNVEVTEK